MPGGVRSRQPWLYLGADWAASDILRPEKEAEEWGGEEGEGGGRYTSGGGTGKWEEARVVREDRAIGMKEKWGKKEHKKQQWDAQIQKKRKKNCEKLPGH